MNIRSIDPTLQDVILCISLLLCDEDKLTGIRQTIGIKKNSQQHPREYDMTISPNCLKTDFSSIKTIRINIARISPIITVIPAAIEESSLEVAKTGIAIAQVTAIPKAPIIPWIFFSSSHIQLVKLYSEIH
jgi:hypothetical protein